MKLKSLPLVLFSLLMGNAVYGAVTLVNPDATIDENRVTRAVELTTTDSHLSLVLPTITPGQVGTVQVEWGDGSTEEWKFEAENSDISHDYEDGVPVHNVIIYANTAAFNWLQFNLSAGASETGITSFRIVNTLPNVTTLNLTNQPVATVSGMENLPALTNLIIQTTSLTGLDVSKNAALIELDLSTNPNLASLTLPTASVLETLEINDATKLTSLDVSGFANLKTLYAYNCGLTSINLSGCLALEAVSLSGNKLTGLDASDCVSPALVLNCNTNELTSISVPASIKWLDCSTNKLNFGTLPRLSAAQYVSLQSANLSMTDNDEEGYGYYPQALDPVKITANGFNVDLSGLTVPGDNAANYTVAWQVYISDYPSYQSLDGMEYIADNTTFPNYSFDGMLEYLNSISGNWGFSTQTSYTIYATITHSAYPKLELTTTEVTLPAAASDTEAPKVESTTPEAGATDVDITQDIKFIYNEDIVLTAADVATATADFVDANPNYHGATVSIENGNELTIYLGEPDTPEETSVTITIPAGFVKDAAGNETKTEEKLSFTVINTGTGIGNAQADKVEAGSEIYTLTGARVLPMATVANTIYIKKVFYTDGSSEVVRFIK